MSTQINEPVSCADCGHVFPREPSLEVPCPTCGAKVGQSCRVARPSEHVHSAAFAGLPPWGHDARELLACAEGKYVHPAFGCHGLSPEQARRKFDLLTTYNGAAPDGSDLPLFLEAL